MRLGDYLIERGRQNEEAVKPDPNVPTAEEYDEALSELGVNVDDEA